MYFLAFLISAIALAKCASIGDKLVENGRIVGGSDAEIGDFPYQVSLQYLGQHICGGCILSETVILTAAHCTQDMPSWMLTVRAGSSYTNRGGSVRNVKKVIQHEQYNTQTQDNDIAVILLRTGLTFGKTINQVGLAMNRPSDNATVVISGWGATSEGGPSPRKLQAVRVKTVGQEACKKLYGSGAITDNMICAAGEGKDSCQGDSGGPLVDEESDALLGVVSWGIGCARPDYAGVYASVPELLKWILEKTSQRSLLLA